MWRVHETGCFPSGKEGMMLDSFSSIEVREVATAPGIFLEKGIKWCFLKPFSADCMFCFGGFWAGIFFFLLSKYRNWGFVIEECFLYLEGLCLIKRVRRTPRFFLKKNFFYENEEFIFSKLIKMTIYSGFFFISYFGDSSIWYWK